jgi:predicted permease
MLAELWNDLRYRVRALLRGAELDRDLEGEIQEHLVREAQSLERRGLTAAEARRQARLAFGGLENVREQTRDARGTRRVQDSLQDVSYAWRRIRRSPGLSLTIVGLVALTIGSATVVFGVFNAVLLRPLPYGDPARLALVWETRANTSQNVVGGHEFPEWARSNRTFDGLSPMIYDVGMHLTGAGDPLAVLGVRVAAPFFQVMGVHPAVGRAFTADEDTAGRGEVTVLSDRLWRSRFASDPGIVGRTIHLNGRPLQVVGVMPPAFAFPQLNGGFTPDLWLPIAENIERYVGRHYLFVVGRVKTGVTMAQAQADLTGVAKALAIRYPNDSAGHGVNVIPLQQGLVEHLRGSLMLLLGAVGFLLIIGCSNVASLLMARGVSRRREIALELALGASRFRLFRQLVAESLVLSVAGGALAIALASILIDVVSALLPPGSLTVDSITLDPAVLGFAVIVSVLTGLIFGVVPALQASHVGPADTLSHGARTLVGSRTRVRRGLVVAQIALAVPLVLGAILMVRGLVALHRVDPGFVVNGTLAVDLSLRGSNYAQAHRQRSFFDTVEQRLRQAPGVLHAGSISDVPLGGGTSGIGIEVEGKPEQPGQWTSAQYRVVTPGYFKTIGVPFVAGRDFAPSDARLALPLIRWFPQQRVPPDFDRPQAIPVAVINQSMADRLWPDGAVGRRFKVLFSPWITVAGVVRDMHTVSLRASSGPEFYLSAAQEPQSAMTVLVRTAGAPLDIAPVVQSTIAAVDPALPIAAMRTLAEIVDGGFNRPRFVSALLGSFAGMALILMTAGVYGLLSFTTAQRLPEIAVRVALGATRRQISTLVLRDAAMMTGIGIVGGLVAALALGRFIEDQLYGVRPNDPIAMVAVAALVAAAVGLACSRQVLRAGRVDPVEVLRHQ